MLHAQTFHGIINDLSENTQRVSDFSVSHMTFNLKPKRNGKISFTFTYSYHETEDRFRNALNVFKNRLFLQ